MSLQGLRKGLLLRLPSLAARSVRSSSAIKTNPAATPLSPLETVIGLSVFFIATLGPAGYILVNLENYKKRD